MKIVLVCGSRNWRDRDLVYQELDNLADLYDEVQVVHGDCKTGADKFADDWCLDRDYETLSLRRFPANWSKGRSSGPLRNSEMAAYAGKDAICIAFRSKGKSPGTDDMIAKARRVGMDVRVYHER